VSATHWVALFAGFSAFGEVRSGTIGECMYHICESRKSPRLWRTPDTTEAVTANRGFRNLLIQALNFETFI
jgi:hypothetical protein